MGSVGRVCACQLSGGGYPRTGSSQKPNDPFDFCHARVGLYHLLSTLTRIRPRPGLTWFDPQPRALELGKYHSEVAFK